MKIIANKLNQGLDRLYKAYGRNRKMMNENIGVIVSVFGLFISLIAVVEADRARRSTDDIGKQSVEAARKAAYEQHRSVEAQIEQMQLSARPFVKIMSGQYHHEVDKYYLRLNMTAIGNTPAFNVKLKMKCEMDVDESKATNLLVQARTATPDQTVDAAAELDNGEEAFGGCYATESTFLSGIQLLQVGEISYYDFFKVRHTTTFCLQAGVGHSEEQGTLERCRGFMPEVT